MTKSKTIDVIFWGGFHGSPEVKFRVDSRFVTQKCTSFLTDHHKKKLKKHFCGIKGCACGSYARAEWKVMPRKGDKDVLRAG